MTKHEISRRELVLGAGAVGLTAFATGGIAGLSGCSGASAESEHEESKAPGASLDSIEWENEADVVILGTGGAGLAAAITMHAEDLGSCFILEAASEENAGGNSRACGQIVFSPLSPEGAAEYQTACNEPYTVEPELIEAWAQSVCENHDWLNEVCDCDLQVVSNNNPEYPERPGADDVEVYAQEGRVGEQALWKEIMATAEDLGVNIYYEARAVDLIVDENAGVVGVTTEDGRNFKANKGVIMGCGGFEANEDLMKQYYQIGIPSMQPRGTWYNRGDGITMAQKVGAQLWHMNNFVGNAWSIQLIPDIELSNSLMAPQSKDYIIIGPDGCRFQSEDDSSRLRHGKLAVAGTWLNMQMPTPSWCVFGQKSFDAGITGTGQGTSSFAGRVTLNNEFPSCADLLDAGLIKKIESAEDLASFTGLDASLLQGTLDRYNKFAEANKDEDFGRGTALDELGYPADSPAFNGKVHIEAYDLEKLEYPLYAVEIRPTILNTQGGPKRNENCQIVDANDEPIARLYGAGELGAIYVNEYNGGGNFSEAIANGRVAARHCAGLQAWNAG